MDNPSLVQPNERRKVGNVKDPLRIGLIGHFLHDSGCSKSIIGYVRAARLLGYDLRVSKLSLLDRVTSKHFPLTESDWKPDLLVLIFESYQYLSENQIIEIEKSIPRNRRLIVDQDGKYSEITAVGVDSNHSNEKSRQDWLSLYNRLADRIVQPTILAPARGANRFLFFGVDQHRKVREKKSGKKSFDIAYVGNNWYRWEDICWFIEGIDKIRSKLNRIALFGKWWSGKPLPSLPEHTYSNPAYLFHHGVEFHNSVQINNLEATMSRAYINPIFIRPLLGALQFVTPRMFETFRAHTVPLIAPGFGYAEGLYGSSVKALCLGDDPSEKVEFVLSNYQEMTSLVAEIAFELETKHSYERRLLELIEQF